MHTYCRPFFLIDYSCADFMHTYSVLCRLLADLVHTLSRVYVFHSNAAARPAGGRQPFLRGRSRGGGALAATAAGTYALVGNVGAAGGAAAAITTFEGKAQPSVVHLVLLLPAAGAARRGEGGHHALAGRGDRTCGGVLRRGFGRGWGQGLDARAAGGASASARTGPARLRCVRGETRGKGRGERACVRAGRGPRCTGIRGGNTGDMREQGPSA
jgi:hypothetical protein